MSLSADVEVPVNVSGNKAPEENRIRVNGVPQTEDETQSPLDDLNQFQQNLEHVRREAFDQGFQDGWIMAYGYWATFALDQQRPPMNYQYPIRPGLGGGLGGLGLGGLRNRNLQQPRQNQPPQESNPNHLLRPRGGLHEWTRRVRVREGDHEVEETRRTGPPREFLQPGDLPGLFGHNQGASDMSEANPNTTNNVWMRGGGGEKDNPRDDAATPSPSRKPRKNQKSNAPPPQTSTLAPDRTIYPRERYSSSRPSQATREEPIPGELPLDINFIPMLTWYPWKSPHAHSLREEATRREHIRKERARRDAARRSDADARPVSSQNPQRRPQDDQGNAGDEYAGPHCTGCVCKKRV